MELVSMLGHVIAEVETNSRWCVITWQNRCFVKIEGTNQYRECSMLTVTDEPVSIFTSVDTINGTRKPE